MKNTQEHYRTEDIGNFGNIARAHVLATFPNARMIHREPWDMDMTWQWSIHWEGQETWQWLHGSTRTRGTAWIVAWQNIQREMLEKLGE